MYGRYYSILILTFADEEADREVNDLLTLLARLHFALVFTGGTEMSISVPECAELGLFEHP